MPLYEVFVTKEVNYHVTNIEADSEEEAIKLVQQAYDSNSLDDEHIQDVNFIFDGANEETMYY